jgi:hypothetical protein
MCVTPAFLRTQGKEHRRSRQRDTHADHDRKHDVHGPTLLALRDQNLRHPSIAPSQEYDKQGADARAGLVSFA